MAHLDARFRRDAIEVLYVEDQCLNTMLMAALFEQRPALRLTLAEDVQSALRLAPTVRPALLLLDLRLPDGDGCALLKRLRGMRHLAGVPAIAVTAEPDFDPLGTGFAEVWRKPIVPHQVLARLDHWLATCAPGEEAAPSVRGLLTSGRRQDQLPGARFMPAAW